MRAPALALSALEVAVRRRGAALPLGELVGVHAQAHRAAGEAPFGAEVLEDPVEALGFGLETHLGGAGNDHEAHGTGLLPAAHHLGGGPEILDAGVRARAEEDGVDGDVAQRRARGQAHVGQGVGGGDLVVLVGEVLGRGHVGRQRQALTGVRPPRDEGLDVGGLEDHLGVEGRVLIGVEGLPVRDRLVPFRALRGVRTALDVLEGRLVGGDHARPGPGLDRHVADRHPGLHRQ